MNFKKYPLSGIYGKTVVYTLENLRFEDNNIKFGPFRFYTPLGTLADEKGNYFDVPTQEIPVIRDDQLDIEIVAVVIMDEEVTAYPVFEGEKCPVTQIGLEGDVVLTVNVPADLSKPLECHYKEVTSD